MQGLTFFFFKPFNINVSYLGEVTKGMKPTSIGTSAIELPKPVDYKTDTIAAEMSYDVKPLSLALGLSYSRFSNNNEYLLFNNPSSTNAVIRSNAVEYVILVSGNTYGNINFKGTLLDLPLNSALNIKAAGGLSQSNVDLMKYGSGQTLWQLSSPSFEGKVQT